jgi:hypothetical protein
VSLWLCRRGNRNGDCALDIRLSLTMNRDTRTQARWGIRWTESRNGSQSSRARERLIDTMSTPLINEFGNAIGVNDVAEILNKPDRVSDANLSLKVAWFLLSSVTLSICGSAAR